MAYDHVIFDKDGVLLKTSTSSLEWMDRIRAEEARKRGGKMTIEQSKAVFRAESREDLRKISRDTGLEIQELRDIESAVTEKKIEKIRNNEIPLFEGAKATLEKITQTKSVVSNAPLKATEFSIRNFGLEHLFETVNAPGLQDLEKYVERKKPSPEMVNEVIQKTGATSPVLVGDSDTDIQAAENAGIDSIHLRTTGETDEEPTHSVDSLEEIPALLD